MLQRSTKIILDFLKILDIARQILGRHVVSYNSTHESTGQGEFTQSTMPGKIMSESDCIIIIEQTHCNILKISIIVFLSLLDEIRQKIM